MFEAMGKYNEELVKAGIMLAGDGRRDEWADQIAPGTLIEITVREPPFHTFSLGRW